ncbi:hypothetical protein BHE74_00041023 [Ensete ventricosum]|nr:hypothetical protein BHE74_00041023 [Ensete ventricosum]
MISVTLVGLQSVPGLVILYGCIVKKKWAVNSASYDIAFDDKLLPFRERPGRPSTGSC